MAARTTAPISNVQYEDLRPKSEWKEENAANVLRVHLPDFKKEQVQITYVHSTRIIRVTGERQIAGSNKWSRFNQAFAVPQNCEVSNIHAKFADGILIITLPKSNITPPPITLPKQDSKLQPQATNITNAGSQESAAATAKPAATSEAKEQKKGVEETRKPDIARATSLREVLKDTKPEKGPEEQAVSRPIPPPPPAPSSSKISDGLVTKQKEDEEIGKKRKESSSPSSPMVTPSGVDTEGVKKRKESSSSLGTIKEEKMKEVKSMAAAAKKAVKGRLRMETGDDRQRLVNVGVAVLVVAALGAYLYYTYRPSSSSSSSSLPINGHE